MIAQILSKVGLGTDPVEAPLHADRLAAVAETRAREERESVSTIAALERKIGTERDRAKVAIAAAEASAESTRVACAASIVDEADAALKPLVVAHVGQPTRDLGARFAAVYVKARERSFAELGAELSRVHLTTQFWRLAIARTPGVVNAAQHGGGQEIVAQVEELHNACLRGHPGEVSDALDALDVAIHRVASLAKVPAHPHAQKRFEIICSHALDRDAAKAIANLEASDSERAHAELAKLPRPVADHFDGTVHTFKAEAAQ